MVNSEPLRGPVSADHQHARHPANPCGDHDAPRRVLVMRSYDPATGDDPISWCKRNCQHGWEWEPGPRGGIWYSMAFDSTSVEDAAWFGMVWG